MTTPSKIEASTLVEGETLATHTPGPWEAQEPDICDYGGVAIIGLQVNPDGSPICSPTNGIVAYAAMFPTEIDREDTSRAEANAAFIVRACNAYDDMLAALQSLCGQDATYVSDTIRIQCDDHGDAIRRMRLARAAIAKAVAP